MEDWRKADREKIVLTFALVQTAAGHKPRFVPNLGLRDLSEER